MKRNAIAVALSLFAGAAALAQVPAPLPSRGMLCPRPTVRDIKGEISPPVQDPSDLPANLIPLTAGSTWNQTAINKGFAHTFHFKMDVCCGWSSGTLTMEVKALQGGGAGTSSSANDGVSVFSNKVVVPPQASPWSSGVQTGATKTLTFQIPASALARDMVSIYVEDDTAVVWAHLHLEGCCIR